jgi:hypothetical protein
LASLLDVGSSDGANPMLTLAICGALVGGVLGMRFTALILVPSVFIGLAVGAVAGIAGHEGVGVTLLTMLCIATALQLGYLGGTMTRHVVAASHTDARQSRPTPRPAHQS